MKHIFKIKVYKMFGLKKSFKIKTTMSIDELNRNIKEQYDGDLVSFCNINGEFIHFDRCSIEKIIVKEKKNNVNTTN